MASNPAISDVVACPQVVLQKVRQFEEHLETYSSGEYNEAQLRVDFINPLLYALGWDVENREGRHEAYREVVYEDAVKVGGTSKAPDYGFYIGGRAGQRKFFLEAKRPSVAIRLDPVPAFQLRRYARSAELPLSILTNFKDFIVYDTRYKPDPKDKPTTAAILTVKYTEYPERWDEIASIFSRDAVLRGSFDKYAAGKRKRGMEPLGDDFLEDIERWRKLLAKDIAANNPQLSVEDLNFAVQRTIDRILFLRICEDRGIEPAYNLKGLLNGDKVYPRLGQVFRFADDRYNSGIFHFPRGLGGPGQKPDPDRAEPPDELTLDLEISDKALQSIIKELYDSGKLFTSYAYAVIPPDILGHVYEQFLGKVITLSPSHRVSVEEKPEVRKAGGVYYTPTYIVDYIVKNTVGKLLEGKTPKEAEKIRILDPASGSGSFLIGAYQYLLNWHLDWYLKDGPEKYSGKKDSPLSRVVTPSLESAGGAISPSLEGGGQGVGGAQDQSQRPTQPSARTHPPAPSLKGRGRYDFRLSTKKRKEILLNSIYGVDIDPQAVEVTKLSLLLKVLEGESQDSLNAQAKFFHERALPDLGRNIKCGNSLIGDDFDDSELSEAERRKINKFNWQREFPAIMKPPNGGFDAVIGNPPYLFITEVPREQRAYYESHYHGVDYRFDLYGAFIERAVAMWLRPSGRFGFIIPHTLLSNDSFGALRAILSNEANVYHVLDFGPGVFEGAKNETMILLFAKGAPDARSIVDVARTEPKLFPLLKQQFQLKQQDWIRPDGSPWLIHVSGEIQPLLSRMSQANAVLGDFVTINQGCRTGDNETYLARSAKSSKWKPAAGGKNIGRYEPIAVNTYVRYEPELLDAPRRPELFFGAEKLIVQEVRNISLARRIVATYDQAQIVGLQSTNVINQRPTCHHDLRFLLGLINSSPVNVYFRFKFPGNNHIPSNQLSRIPVPAVDKAAHDRMVKLVDRMLDLHKRRHDAKTQYEAERIDRDIESTDRQIDQLVYELYGLSEEEIAIVEQATAKPASSETRGQPPRTSQEE
jgi:hypothetical protein